VCVHPMLCQGGCDECKVDAERRKRREEGTRKMIATKAAKKAALQKSTR